MSPDRISFNAAISACERDGRWQTALVLFLQLITRWNPGLQKGRGGDAQGLGFKIKGVLGSPWDLVTTYNLAYNLLIIPLNGLTGVSPIICRVIIPVICAY